jgi:methylated-DNA-[protein]-cysteine S-methyltransferase
MQGQINIHYYYSIFGELVIGAYENQLRLCDWRYRKMRDLIDSNIYTWEEYFKK